MISDKEMEMEIIYALSSLDSRLQVMNVNQWRINEPTWNIPTPKTWKAHTSEIFHTWPYVMMDRSEKSCSLKILSTVTFKLCTQGTYGINEFCESVWTPSPRWFTTWHIWKYHQISNNLQIWSTPGPKCFKGRASKPFASSLFSHSYQWIFKLAHVSTDV